MRSMIRRFPLFDDAHREAKQTEREEQFSPFCDFIYYRSSIHPELVLGARILKPGKPGRILAMTHGWHSTAPAFAPMDAPVTDYLVVQADMRGRAFSDGAPDANGWELYDVIDAIECAKKRYREYISDERDVFFQCGSGGGGNAYALAGKFPDYFAHITALYGISDYEKLYEDNLSGDLRDEMDVWIAPGGRGDAYRARSGIHLLQNLLTPMAIVHGENDARVSVEQARAFCERAQRLGKGDKLAYRELPGIGGGDHLSGITEEGLRSLHDFTEKQRLSHAEPVEIPLRGRMTVGGYLKTKHFFVRLESIDDLCEIEYDVGCRKIAVSDGYRGNVQAIWKKDNNAKLG